MGRGRIGLSAFAACLAVFFLVPSAAAAAPPSITDAFDRNGNGFSIEEDCPVYDSEDGGRRICSGDVESFDGVTLDVDLTLPKDEDDGSRRPLMVMLNGFDNDKHYWESNTDEGDGRDLWHWNNHWFSKHGYYVLTYTPRGFSSDPHSGNRPPTVPDDSSSAEDTTAPSAKDPTDAKIRLKTREFEIRDTQWLSALVAASRAFSVDPKKLAVTGNSYGGGESWTQASQPQWTFPHDQTKGALPVLQLQVAIPKYGWTDLAYSLIPNGHPTEGSIYESSQGQANSPNGEGNPMGVPKASYEEAFYAMGSKSPNVFEDGNPLSGCTTSEEGCYNIHIWHARGAAGEPYEATVFEEPLVGPLASGGDPFVKQIRRGLTEFRGSYYQDWGQAAQEAGRKVAIFGIEGWTDDLFTAVESFRQFKYLKRLDPRWPIEVELADVGHPRAQNKPETWRRLNGQAFQFLVEHIQGSHEQETTVASEPTMCVNDGEPDRNIRAADRLTAQSPEGLSNGRLLINYAQGDTLLWTSGADDQNGPATDPVTGAATDVLFGSEGECRTSPAPPPEDSYSRKSPPLKEESTYIGLGSVEADYTFVGISGQLNARVWDVPPSGGKPILMTRGTYRLRNDGPEAQAFLQRCAEGTTSPADAAQACKAALEECARSPNPDCPTTTGRLNLPLFGNHWQLKPGHQIRIDLLQVDAPFLRGPSNVPSSVEFKPPTLNLPTRESGEREVTEPPPEPTN